MIFPEAAFSIAMQKGQCYNSHIIKLNKKDGCNWLQKPTEPKLLPLPGFSENYT